MGSTVRSATATAGVVLPIAAVTGSVGAMLAARRAATVHQLRSLTALSAGAARLSGHAGALILGAAVYMVAVHGVGHGADGHITWTSGWMIVSLGFLALVALLGRTVEEPHTKRVHTAARVTPPGLVPAQLDALRRDPLVMRVSMFGAAQLFSFLFLMSTKPALARSLVTVLVKVLLVGVLSVIVRQVVLREPVSEPTSEVAR